MANNNKKKGKSKKNKNSRNAKPHKKNKGKQNQQTQLLPRLSSSSAQTSEYKHEIAVFKKTFSISDSTRSTPPEPQKEADFLVTEIRTLGKKAKVNDAAEKKILKENLEEYPEAYIDLAIGCKDKPSMLHAISDITSLIAGLSEYPPRCSRWEQQRITRFKSNQQAALIILNYNVYTICLDEKKYLKASLKELTTFFTNDTFFSMLCKEHQIAIVYCIAMLFELALREETIISGSTIQHAVKALFCNQKSFPHLLKAIREHLKYRDILQAILGFAKFYIRLPTQMIDTQQSEIQTTLNLKECCMLFKDIFTGMLEQKQILLGGDKYKSYTKESATYSFAGIYELILELVSIYKTYYQNKNCITTVVPHLDCEQLLSDIQALHRFLQYLLQSQQIDPHLLFRGTCLLIAFDVTQEELEGILLQMVEARLNDLNNRILSAIEIQIIHKSKLETFIKSLEVAKNTQLETVLTTQEIRHVSFHNATALFSRDNPSADAGDDSVGDDSKDTPEEKCIADEVTTPDLQKANEYFKARSFDLALTTLISIEPKIPAAKVEKLVFSLRCLSELFDKQRSFIRSAMKAMEIQADYVRAHCDNLGRQQIWRKQQQMDLTIIKLFNLMKEHKIGLEPATTINEQAYGLLTQCQQDIVVQMSDSISDNISAEILNACRHLHNWQLDITKDTVETEAFKAWSKFWSETMVKAIMGVNAKKALTEIYSNNLQQAWTQFLQNYFFLRDLSEKTKHYLNQRPQIIEKLKEAGRIRRRRTQPSETQRFVITVLRWVRERNKAITTHVNQVPKTISKNREVIMGCEQSVSDEQKGSQPILVQPDSSPSTSSSQQTVFSPVVPEPPHSLATTQSESAKKAQSIASGSQAVSSLGPDINYHGSVTHGNPPQEVKHNFPHPPDPVQSVCVVSPSQFPVVYNAPVTQANTAIAATQWLAGTGMPEPAPTIASAPQLVGHILVPLYTPDAPYGFQPSTLFQPLSQAQAPASSTIRHVPTFFRPSHSPPEDIQAKIKRRVGEVIASLNSSCERKAQTELKALVESKDFHTLGGFREQGDINLHELLLNANAILQGQAEGSALVELMKVQNLSRMQSLAISAPAAL